jgi:succinate dehydrogenase / fumarate reductase membrane anchor subunit
MKNRYRSDLPRIKYFGYVGSGSRHWWYQRFTAILLVLLTGWLFYFSWDINHSELHEIVKVFKKPHHIITVILFVSTGLYHAVLGMQVVIEDYIHCRTLKLVLLLMVQIFSIVTSIAFLLAVLCVMTL